MKGYISPIVYFFRIFSRENFSDCRGERMFGPLRFDCAVISVACEMLVLRPEWRFGCMCCFLFVPFLF